MSAGRSMATDLPMPSGMKRDVASLAATWMTCVWCGSAACAAFIGAKVGAMPAPASKAASDVARINVLIAQCPAMCLRSPNSLIACSFRCRLRAHAKTDDVDGVFLARGVVHDIGFRSVGDAAQRQRQRAALLRQHQRFGLARREFERRGLA